MNYKPWIPVIVILFLGVIVGVALYAFQPQTTTPSSSTNDSTSTPVVITPRPVPSVSFSETIPTDYGNMTLAYTNGTATLSGSLNRSTPCINWQMSASGTKDLPLSQVIFMITQTSTSQICAQVLGKPQSISLSTSAGPDTKYLIRVRDTIVFSSKLNSQEPSGS